MLCVKFRNRKGKHGSDDRPTRGELVGQITNLFLPKTDQPDERKLKRLHGVELADREIVVVRGGRQVRVRGFNVVRQDDWQEVDGQLVESSRTIIAWREREFDAEQLALALTALERASGELAEDDGE